MDDGTRYLTTADIAGRLGVTERSVRRWIRDKQLPALDLGRRVGYRVTEADLDRFLDERMTATPAYGPKGDDER